MTIFHPENLSIQPWDGEHELLEGLLDKPGGNWVAAAACLDYAHLTDVAAPVRIATLPTTAPAHRDFLLGEYMRQLELSRHLVDEVEALAIGLTEVIPFREVRTTFKTGMEFLNQTVGHTAVSALVDSFTHRLA